MVKFRVHVQNRKNLFFFEGSRKTQFRWMLMVTWVYNFCGFHRALSPFPCHCPPNNGYTLMEVCLLMFVLDCVPPDRAKRRDCPEHFHTEMKGLLSHIPPELLAEYLINSLHVDVTCWHSFPRRELLLRSQLHTPFCAAFSVFDVTAPPPLHLALNFEVRSFTVSYPSSLLHMNGLCNYLGSYFMHLHTYQINKRERKLESQPTVPLRLSPLWGPLYQSRAAKTTARLQGNIRMTCTLYSQDCSETGGIVCHILLEVDPSWKASQSHGTHLGFCDNVSLSLVYACGFEFGRVVTEAIALTSGWGNTTIDHNQLPSSLRFAEVWLYFLFQTNFGL